MPYVMVPVPTEHEQEFGEWVLKRSLEARLSAWPAGGIENVFAQIAPRAQAMVGEVARLGPAAVPAAELAELVQAEVSEVMEVIAEVCQYCFDRDIPPLVMVEQGGGAGGAGGQSYLMGDEVRRTLRTMLAG